MLVQSTFRRFGLKSAMFRRMCISGHQVSGKSFLPLQESTDILSIKYPYQQLSFSRLYSNESSRESKQSTEQKDSKIRETESSQKAHTTKDRLKIITTQYGAFGMAFHITISLASLGMFYFLVYSGFDFTSAMEWLGMESSKIAAGASTFVVAYAVHKVFAPVRIGITFVSVPILVKHFRRIGFFKNK